MGYLDDLRELERQEAPYPKLHEPEDPPEPKRDKLKGYRDYAPGEGPQSLEPEVV